jgi:peroxiredoxin
VIIRIGLLCLLALAAVAAESPSGAQRAEQVAATLVGQPAPALQLRGVDGGTIDLGAYRGKQAVYLKFWATWCHPCIEQMPHFQHAHATAGKDLAVIGINAGFNDTPAAIREFQREHHISMPMAIDDGQAAAAFNLRVTPMHVVIDRAGIVRFIGHLADARVDRALQAVRAPIQLEKLEKLELVKAGNSAKYELGSRVQGLRLQPLDARQPLRLPVNAGRPTVLVFISSWCESYLAQTRPAMAARCKRAREQLTALPASLQSRADWIWIDSGLWNDAADVREYRDTHGIKAPMVLDSATTLFNTFDVREVPTLLVIDGAGVLRQRLRGDESDLQRRLQDATAPRGANR